MSDRAQNGRPRGVDVSRRGRARGVAGRLLLVLAGLTLVGCEADSWMFAPNVVGRWEHTPTRVPILDRIELIEPEAGDFVDVTPVQPEDLIPEPVDYRLAPGDVVTLDIFDLLGEGPTQFQRSLDARGFLDIPEVGRLDADGLTTAELTAAIEQRLRDRGLVQQDPLVVVQAPGRRQATYSIFGAIPSAARYGIPYPNYRLLEALTDAGGISPVIKQVYVIRQVPLDESVERGLRFEPEDAAGPDPMAPIEGDVGPEGSGEEGQDLLDLIEELTGEGEEPSPGVLGLSVLSEGGVRARRVGRLAQADGQDALIDLPEGVGGSGVGSGPGGSGGAGSVVSGDGSRAGEWVFLDGSWVQVMPSSPEQDAGSVPEGEDPLASGSGEADLVTQRVIEVPTEPLLQGVASYNIVIRPGDVIRVPTPPTGVVYAGGPGINRPGTYNLPFTGRLTLTRLIFSAGGLSAVSIPDRVDLTRMVGENAQATIRLDVAAIFEGTQPDILLKPDDMLNFGTDFWATPMAVIRNGFRMSYGFGFLLDRNFGTDVFGAPPTNVGNR